MASARSDFSILDSSTALMGMEVSRGASVTCGEQRIAGRFTTQLTAAQGEVRGQAVAAGTMRRVSAELPLSLQASLPVPAP